MTARQQIIVALASIVAEREFHTWKANREIVHVSDNTLNELVENYTRGKGTLWRYYLEQTDKQYFAMAKAIRNEAHKRLEHKIDLALLNEELEQHKQATEETIDVFAAMESITLGGRDKKVSLIFDHGSKSWSAECWLNCENALAEQRKAYGKTPQAAMLNLLKKL